MTMLQGKNDDATSSTGSVKTSTSSVVLTSPYRQAGPQPPSSKGHIYISIAINRSTPWVEAHPLKDILASSCADVFMASRVTQFSVPSTLTLDNGTQFTSAVWMSLWLQLGVHHIISIAYHPLSNSMMKQVHQQLKGIVQRILRGVNNKPK
jgi:hypothetical protein